MGIILALWAAFFETIKDAIQKHNVKDIDPYLLGWLYRTLSLIFIAPCLYFIEIPQVWGNFFIILVISWILNSCATLLYLQALKHWDISNTVPLVALTPCFMLITSPIMIGEKVNSIWFIGVVLWAIWAYMLAYEKWDQNFFAPFKSLIRNKGSRYMLIVACIYSITSNIDKMGIQQSSALFWLFSLNAILCCFLFIIMIFVWKRDYRKLLKSWPTVLLSWGIGTVALVFQVKAVAIEMVTYVISVKRMSVIFSVLIWYFVFHEKNIKARFIGSIFLISGVVFITLT